MTDDRDRPTFLFPSFTVPRGPVDFYGLDSALVWPSGDGVQVTVRGDPDGVHVDSVGDGYLTASGGWCGPMTTTMYDWLGPLLRPWERPDRNPMPHVDVLPARLLTATSEAQRRARVAARHLAAAWHALVSPDIDNDDDWGDEW